MAIRLEYLPWHRWFPYEITVVKNNIYTFIIGGHKIVLAMTEDQMVQSIEVDGKNISIDKRNIDTLNAAITNGFAAVENQLCAQFRIDTEEKPIKKCGTRKILEQLIIYRDDNKPEIIKGYGYRLNGERAEIIQDPERATTLEGTLAYHIESLDLKPESLSTATTIDDLFLRPFPGSVYQTDAAQKKGRVYSYLIGEHRITITTGKYDIVETLRYDDEEIDPSDKDTIKKLNKALKAAWREVELRAWIIVHLNIDNLKLGDDGTYGFLARYKTQPPVESQEPSSHTAQQMPSEGIVEFIDPNTQPMEVKHDIISRIFNEELSTLSFGKAMVITGQTENPE